jgi:hypothetical protein
VIRSEADISRLYERVRQALSRIASAREGGDGRIIVSVPVLYPSGSTASVGIDSNKDQCFVSDLGMGFAEAEFEGAADSYGRAASATAERFGVRYDGHSIFTLWVPMDRIEAAIINVANASCEATGQAIRAAAEIKFPRRNEQLFQRVARVFGEQSVARRADVVGRHATWEAHNVVALPNQRKAIFEYVTEHQNSISSKFLMFSDIKQADETVSLNAVVSRIDQLSPKAQIIGDVANILALRATDHDYLEYAKAS